MGSSHRKAYGTQSLRTARTCSAWFINHDLRPNIFPCHPFHTVHNNIILIYLWSFLCQTVAKDWMHQQKNWTSFTFQHWQCASHNLMYYLVQRGLFFKDVMNKLQQCLIFHKQKEHRLIVTIWYVKFLVIPELQMPRITIPLIEWANIKKLLQFINTDFRWGHFWGWETPQGVMGISPQMRK